MKSNALTEREVISFSIIRRNTYHSFSTALDKIRNKFPDIWNKKQSRKRLENAFMNYYRMFFCTKRHYVSREQATEIRERNKGYY